MWEKQRKSHFEYRRYPGNSFIIDGNPKVYTPRYCKNVDKSAALQKLPGCHCTRWIFIPSWNYAFLIKIVSRWSWKGCKFCILCLVVMFEGAFLVDIWALQPAPKPTALTHCLPRPRCELWAPREHHSPAVVFYSLRATFGECLQYWVS